MRWKILLACFLLALIDKVHGGFVHITLVDGAVEKRAVCLDGSPAGYYFDPGSGDGVNNWIVYLMGGGWCSEYTCFFRMNNYLGSTNVVKSHNCKGILSSNQSVNPEFYNWNRVFVHYCDGSSFLGDTEGMSRGVKLQLRGSRIFSSVMDELLQVKGMKNAKNAILSGGSAGGLATILNCDGFQKLLPNDCKVKCVPDSGFFIHAKNLPLADYREGAYSETIKFHNLTDLLPKACTSKMNASLCMFAENLIEDVKTPLFILNPIFDTYQLGYTLKPNKPDDAGWNGTCVFDPTIFSGPPPFIPNPEICTPPQFQLVKDFGKAFLDTISGLSENPSRGLFLNACYSHVFMEDDDLWSGPTTPCKLEDKTISQAVADWFFDRSPIKLIDTRSDAPMRCQ